jgi:hypothetical protein
MVNTPSIMTLATPLPEIVPSSALEKTETLAGPPVIRPASAVASRTKKSPIPVIDRNAEKTINRIRTELMIAIGMP